VPPGSADRDEIRRARVNAGSLAELGDLVDESHNQMGAERLGEPAGVCTVVGCCPLSMREIAEWLVPWPRQLGLAEPKLASTSDND